MSPKLKAKFRRRVLNDAECVLGDLILQTGEEPESENYKVWQRLHRMLMRDELKKRGTK